MSSTKALFVMALLLLCACAAAPVTAQEQTNTRTTPQPPATAAAAAAQQRSAQASSSTPNDIEITANVTARELRFEAVPNPTVEFTGQPERETVWEAERQNLPRPVQPGVTYRNIGIQLRISSRFADIERIVAEALGEVPVTDAAPGVTAAPQSVEPQSTEQKSTEQQPAANSPAPMAGRKP